MRKKLCLRWVLIETQVHHGGLNYNRRHVRLACVSASPSHFSQFEQLLIDKYGQSQSKEILQDIANSYAKIDSWSLPSTKIELTRSSAVGAPGILSIIYSDHILKKEKLDKL
jgi:hypothetical protein